MKRELELSEKARALVEAARSGHAPAEADKLRVREKLHAAIAAGARGPTLAKAAGAKWGWMIAGGLAAAGAAGGVYAWRGVEEVVPPAAIAVVDPPRVLEPRRIEPPPLVIEMEEAPPVEVAIESSDTHVAPAASTLELELALLRQAQTALRAGDAAAALAAAAEHARRFPAGALTEERLASQIIAHCTLGQYEESDRLRTALSERAPTSHHLARIDHACRREQDRREIP